MAQLYQPKRASAEASGPKTCALSESLNDNGWAESVGPWRAFKKAQLDHQPERADERDKADEHPPAGFVAVVEAFDIDYYGWDHREQRKDTAEKSDTQFRIVFSGQHIYESQQNANRGQRQNK